MIEPADGQWHISGPQPDLGILADFPLSDATFGQCVFLALTALVIGTSLVAAVLAFVDRQTPHSWAWAAGSLVGLGKGVLDWTDDRGDFFPISAQLPVAMLYKSLDGHWNVNFAIPVVALIYLSRRKRLMPTSP